MGRTTSKRKTRTRLGGRRSRKPKPIDRTQVDGLPGSKSDASSSIAAELAAPEHFPHFSEFPQEIRLQIWAMAAEEQRVVIVNLGLDSAKFRCNASPAILHTCVESREVGLNYYNLVIPLNHPRYYGPVIFYFNFDQDILFLHGTRAWPRIPPLQPVPFCLLRPTDRARVRNVGFDLSAGSDKSMSLHWFHLEKWDGLKRFYLAIQDPKLDFNSQISCLPLQRKDYQAFSSAFFKLGLSNAVPMHPPTPIPWRPVAARIEGIRTGCIRKPDPWKSAEVKSQYDKIRETVRLVKIMNT